ncbi:MAG UNVERIFIED_CONTAM: acyltransferase [Planctomycetaceae bacterium]|jgi:acetyltransferase-like isoleucine patch superfamily enzyme
MSDHGIPENRYNPHCWITGSPQIGEGTWIGAFTLIDGLGGLKIGRGCDISSGAQILSHSTARRCVTERSYGKIDYAETEIGDYVFIGTNAVVLMGARIGHHCIIAAGTVVLEGMVIPPYSLVAGVPGSVRRSIETDIAQWNAQDCQ